MSEMRKHVIAAKFLNDYTPDSPLDRKALAEEIRVLSTKEEEGPPPQPRPRAPQVTRQRAPREEGSSSESDQ